MINKELLKGYADIKGKIKTLTTQAKEIEGQVTEEMNKEEVEKVESDFGTFFFTARKTWTYSDAVKPFEEAVISASDKLKEAQGKEIESGTATAEEKKSLTFRGK